MVGMRYQLILGTKPDLSADKREKILEKIRSLVADAGGKVSKVKRRGLTKLAYPIAKHTEMDLATIFFEVPGGPKAHKLGVGEIGLLQKKLVKMAGVLRAMVIRGEVKSRD